MSEFFKVSVINSVYLFSIKNAMRTNRHSMHGGLECGDSISNFREISNLLQFLFN